MSYDCRRNDLELPAGKEKRLGIDLRLPVVFEEDMPDKYWGPPMLALKGISIFLASTDEYRNYIIHFANLDGWSLLTPELLISGAWLYRDAPWIGRVSQDRSLTVQ